MVRLSQVIRSKVEEILESSEIQAEVTLQGSFARDTWISGEADLDIFARFSPTMERDEWKSATDRTPYHTEFMQTHLTPELRLEARLLKKFAKGIGAYGAEIKIGGFSGMLIDTLALYYHSFMETIRQASSWTQGTLLEIGKPEGIVSPKEKDPNVDLVVIDPVDPNRNLAAAVRPDKLWSFVAAGRQFLRNPGLWYFF